VRINDENGSCEGASCCCGNAEEEGWVEVDGCREEEE
jgi:hypothetical protein